MSLNDTVQTTEAVVAPRRSLELRRKQVVVVGGLPTVSLLPRELRAAARGRSVRRALVGGVVMAAVLAGAAVAAAASVAGSEQARSDAATADSQTLVGQLAKFRDVQTLQQSIALGAAAVEVGSSTEVDWQNQIDALEQDMPSHYTVTAVTADAASPLEAYQQGTSPLELPRAATVQISAKTSDITTLPGWLREIRSVPAYADATASVSSDGESSYTVQIVVHLSSKALVSTGKAAR